MVEPLEWHILVEHYLKFETKVRSSRTHTQNSVIMPMTLLHVHSRILYKNFSDLLHLSLFFFMLVVGSLNCPKWIQVCSQSFDPFQFFLKVNNAWIC